jgi:hypothetical protein
VSEDHDPFSDLSVLRLDPSKLEPRPKSAPAKKAWRRQFIKFPWAWMDQLRTARHVVTYRIALYLVYEHWRNGRRPVTLSNVAMAREGVAPGTKWRGLKELEQAGLIRIERRPRKSPIVIPLLLDGR